jgi:hypothetical protein
MAENMTPRRPLRKSVKTKSIAAELQFATDTCSQDRFAHDGRAGEGHLGNVRVRTQFCANDVAPPNDDVENARWKPCLVQGFGEHLCLERAHLAGLDDSSATRRNRRGKLIRD